MVLCKQYIIERLIMFSETQKIELITRAIGSEAGWTALIQSVEASIEKNGYIPKKECIKIFRLIAQKSPNPVATFDMLKEELNSRLTRNKKTKKVGDPGKMKKKIG